jgi:hypothetical protein
MRCEMTLVTVLTITLLVGLLPRIPLPQEKLPPGKCTAPPHEVCTEVMRSFGE